MDLPCRSKDPGRAARDAIMQYACPARPTNNNEYFDIIIVQQ